MDDKEVQKTTENSLLEELVNNSQKQLFYERVRTVAALVIAVSIVMGIVLVVPKALVTVQKANDNRKCHKHERIYYDDGG